MRKTYVIGDIHGCYRSLLNVLEYIEYDGNTVIFLGDYIDRGPDSKRVVSHLIRLKKEFPRVITLLGNHEAMLLRYLHGLDQQFFLGNGGVQTLLSYGIDPLRHSNLLAALPEEHLAFFHELLLNWEDERYIYVHAGLKPGVHLSLQTAEWCLWAGEDFVSATHDFGKRVIFGHTAFPEPLVRPEKIGIDTGAVYGGRLTCLVLPDEQFISVPGLEVGRDI
jgi:serine/threonine protein phosphatase 1